MATIKELMGMALDELKRAVDLSLISVAIRNHTSDKSVKPLSHKDYDDYDNFSGSLVMLMLLFPNEFLPPQEQVLFSLLPHVNGAGDRAAVLRYEGMPHQKSGKGQNNYRTNLLEAIIGDIGRNSARYTQLLWMHVKLFCLEDGESWHLPQGAFVGRMLRGRITSYEIKLLAFNTCKSVDLNLDHYYHFVWKLAEHVAEGHGDTWQDYWTIQNVTGCCKNSAKSLWPAKEELIRAEMLHDRVQDQPARPLNIAWRTKWQLSRPHLNLDQLD